MSESNNLPIGTVLIRAILEDFGFKMERQGQMGFHMTAKANPDPDSFSEEWNRVVAALIVAHYKMDTVYTHGAWADFRSFEFGTTLSSSEEMLLATVARHRLYVAYAK